MSIKFHLYLIRHAKAFPRGVNYPNDALRPLTVEGEKQAEAMQIALAHLGIIFDALLSSPWTRALQTAQPLQASAKHFAIIPELADDDFPALLTALRGFVQEDAHVALVGHQPWLEQLASWLITGKSKTLRINVKKASIIKVSGVLNAGKLKLQWLLPPLVTAAIATAQLGSDTKAAANTANQLDGDAAIATAQLGSNTKTTMEVLDSESLQDALENVADFNPQELENENFSPEDFS